MAACQWCVNRELGSKQTRGDPRPSRAFAAHTYLSRGASRSGESECRRRWSPRCRQYDKSPLRPDQAASCILIAAPRDHGNVIGGGGSGMEKNRDAHLVGKIGKSNSYPYPLSNPQWLVSLPRSPTNESSASSTQPASHERIPESSSKERILQRGKQKGEGEGERRSMTNVAKRATRPLGSPSACHRHQHAATAVGLGHPPPWAAPLLATATNSGNNTSHLVHPRRAEHHFRSHWNAAANQSGVATLRHHPNPTRE